MDFVGVSMNLLEQKRKKMSLAEKAMTRMTASMWDKNYDA
jgi:hypothetical protein